VHKGYNAYIWHLHNERRGTVLFHNYKICIAKYLSIQLSCSCSLYYCWDHLHSDKIYGDCWVEDMFKKFNGWVCTSNLCILWKSHMRNVKTWRALISLVRSGAIVSRVGINVDMIWKIIWYGAVPIVFLKIITKFKLFF
jgi:hypothetical protein